MNKKELRKLLKKSLNGKSMIRFIIKDITKFVDGFNKEVQKRYYIISFLITFNEFISYLPKINIIKFIEVCPKCSQILYKNLIGYYCSNEVCSFKKRIKNKTNYIDGKYYIDGLNYSWKKLGAD